MHNVILAEQRWKRPLARPHEVLPSLEAGRVQELHADADDAAAAIGLGAMLAGTAAGPALWLRSIKAEALMGPLYGPGLADLGLSPAMLLIAVVRDDLMLLQAAVDALRCPALGAIVVESWGAMPRLDLTVSRRLVLASEKSGVPALLLRIGAAPTASAAHSRWQVACAPSRPLAANAPGLPMLDITLTRRRGAPAGQRKQVEWNADERAFGIDAAALSGAVVSLVADRPAEGVRATG